MKELSIEEKELLLRDLCARLPYGVFMTNKKLRKTFYPLTCEDLKDAMFDDDWDDIPYLRPMSSMTESEKKDILQSLNIHGDIDNEGNLLLGVECDIITLKVCKKYLGELNKRMFDVCHMIEKGLALEAPEGMYNINNE